ncbi:MAG: hypothetical protein ABEI77_08205 [Halorientalis sp.]
MALLWYLDRATGLVAYPVLFLAVVTGIVYNTPDFGRLYTAARRIHIEISVFATLLLLAHGLVGAVDSVSVLVGSVPAPNYPLWYFVAGSLVGVSGLFLLVVAVLGFVDARRFRGRWGPRTVNALAYGGYGFATIHLVAIGTDIGPAWRLATLAGLGVVIYLLVFRLLVRSSFFVTDLDVRRESHD